MENSTMKSRQNIEQTPCAVVHTDVVYMNVKSLGGAKYFVTFQDEATQHLTAIPIKVKSEASD